MVLITVDCYGVETKDGSIVEHANKNGHFNLNVENGLVSLDAKNADLRKILREISRRTSTEIKVDESVRGNVSASFKYLSIEQAITRISSNWGMVFNKIDGQNENRLTKVVIIESGKDKVNVSEENPITEKELQNSQLKKQTFPHHPASHKKAINANLLPGDSKTTNLPKWVPNQLLVQIGSEFPEKDMDILATTKGALVKEYDRENNFFVINLPKHLSVPEAQKWFEAQNIVQIAEPNYLIPIQETPDDTKFSDQWALEKISAVGGWTLEKGSSDVIIAIIDTGVDHNHPDLVGNIWINPNEIVGDGIDNDENGYIDDVKGWDFVDVEEGEEENCIDEDCSVRDNDPMDSHSHGTHVAGIAGAVGNNGLGITGVAWNCRIMAIRAGYKRTGGGGFLEIDDAAKAIRYAANNGARVLNLSWGDYEESKFIKRAINYAAGQDLLICAAAGNDSTTDPLYPAAHDISEIIAVGSTNTNDQRASSSNYDEDWVHVSAPGVSILSTCLNDTYCKKSGTSMSTPHVAGMAALIFSYFPEWTTTDVKARIMDSVDIIPALEGKNVTSGRVNILSAFTLLFYELFGQSNCDIENPCEVDFDGDGDVDGSDLAMFVIVLSL